MKRNSRSETRGDIPHNKPKVSRPEPLTIHGLCILILSTQRKCIYHSRHCIIHFSHQRT